MILRTLLFVSLVFNFYSSRGQSPISLKNIDSIAGSNHDGRNWWDLRHYKLQVNVDIDKKFLSGTVRITYKVLSEGSVMLIDLQSPMSIKKIISNGRDVKFKQDGRFWWVEKSGLNIAGSMDSIDIQFEGSPKSAKNAPWDGGVVWLKDEKGRPWIGTACQGIGASIWWPCKDIQSDEPDNGADMYFTVKDDLTVVSNGRLISSEVKKDNKKLWHWRVTQPINSYDITMNIGHYVKIEDQYKGINGILDQSFYVLDYNLENGKKLFPEIALMLACFENRVGAYPFYEDGYKMIETSFLGMEHQSGIAYGNKFKRGYLGSDRSGTGEGLKWDFILVHESGHEWFGNSVTSNDTNDGWIHEGFTTYLETIYTECLSGKEAAEKYVIGQRKQISNKTPMISKYGVRTSAPGDIYDKGANLIHTIRTIMDDDERFFKMMHSISRKYYHGFVSSKELESFMAKESRLNLEPVFDQYLRTTQIPTLQYTITNNMMTVAWTKVVDKFKMPVLLITKDGGRKWITATDKPVSFKLNSEFDHWDENIYCEYKKVE